MAVKRIPLLGGAYVTKGVIADAQRCVNLFPEKNPQDAGGGGIVRAIINSTLPAPPVATTLSMIV